MSSAVVLHIPHSSAVVPQEYRARLGLDAVALKRELLAMTDWFTDELFDVPDAARVAFPVSRLVLDPEPFLFEAGGVVAARGMGVVYTKTSSGVTLRQEPTAAERAALEERYYRPYQERLTKAVDAALENHGHCLLVGCHSFPSRALPSEPDPDAERPDVCLGTDPFHTPQWLREFAEGAFRARGMNVAVNRPFAGAFVPEKHHRQDSKVLALMVELNRVSYMDEGTGRRTRNHPAAGRAVSGAIAVVAAKCAGQARS